MGDGTAPADSEPNRDREGVAPKYIECCVSEFRTLDADRGPGSVGGRGLAFARSNAR